MTDQLDKQALEIRLARCLELAREFPSGSTAEMIRDLETELRGQIQALENQQAIVAYGRISAPLPGPET
jgi:hypothetical protein